MAKKSITERINQTASAILEAEGAVTIIDVLARMTWLDLREIELWKTGRSHLLISAIRCSEENFHKGVRAYIKWSADYSFIEAEWKCNSLFDEEKTLRISNDEKLNSIFSRHFLKPGITARKKVNLEVKINQCPAQRLYIVGKNVCSKCSTGIGEDEPCWSDGQDIECLRCLGKANLKFLRSGNATLSRRAAKYSKNFVEVVQFNSRKKRYERRGILIDAKALQQAETECEGDADKRADARAKSSEKQKIKDIDFTGEFSEKVRELFPGCPDEEVTHIAEHATVRGSGRVGRTAAAKKLDNQSVRLAVIAYIRHKHTDYDRYLLNRTKKAVARKLIQPALQKKLHSWESA